MSKKHDGDRMTLAEHAEIWWLKQGEVVPPHSTPEWQAMYEKWIEFAFADFPV